MPSYDTCMVCLYCLTGVSYRIVFNKNCIEIATKTVLFKSFQAGMDREFQIGLLSNLVSCFDV